MVLNTSTDINWGSWPDGQTPTLAALKIDTITVAAHEFGHVAGLGHSRDISALMYGGYQGARSQDGPIPLLGQDDINGIVALYPAASGDPEPTSSWCDTHSDHPQYDRKCS